MWIFENIPKSIFIRIRRICSLYPDKLFHARNVVFQLFKQKYSLMRVLAIMNSIGNTKRFELIPYKSNKQINYQTKSLNMWFNVKFNKNFAEFTKTISNKFNTITKTHNWLENINFQVNNSITPNLSSLLIFDHKFKQPSRCTTKPCNTSTCKVCNLIYNGSFILLNNGFKLSLQ